MFIIWNNFLPIFKLYIIINSNKLIKVKDKME